MSSAVARLGVLGGTFNPIHHGHLFSAEVAAAAFHLDRVLLVPAGQNPLKAAPAEPAAVRLEMTRLAAEQNPLLEVSTIDLDRPPPSYTVDTMAQLHVERPGTALYLIVGADALTDLPEWREPERLLDLCEVIVLSRHGYPQEVPPAMRAQFGGRAARLHFRAMPQLDVSSTDLRRRFAAGEPVRYLLPHTVERYVRKHGLYGARPLLAAGFPD